MDANEIYFTFDNYSQNQKFIYFNDNKINFDEKHISDKIIKLFLFLYLFQDEIDENLKKSIKENEVYFYYLINEQWMKLYKEHYEYNELCKYFDVMKNDKLFNYNYKQLKECMKQKNYEKSNEFIFKDLKERNKNFLEENYLKSEIIINTQNIIIKPEINEQEEKNYILLIGNIENANIFYLKYIINFSEENNRKGFFKSFIRNSFDKIMEENENFFTYDNFSQPL